MRDGSTFIGYRDHRQRQGEEEILELEGRRLFSRKKYRGETFSFSILQNLKIQDSIFQKNIFEDHKVFLCSVSDFGIQMDPSDLLLKR